MTTAQIIRTPDQRLRVFVSSTREELAPERAADTYASAWSEGARLPAGEAAAEALLSTQ